MQSIKFSHQSELYYALNRYLNSDSDDPEAVKKIVVGYKNLWRSFDGATTAPQTIKAPAINLAEYKSTPYFFTLRKLSRSVKADLVKYIKTFFIHGSLATMDFVPGFSDLDTYAIVKKEICLNAKKLNEFREKLVNARKFLIEVDPLAHHGFIFCAEQNLDYYPQHFLPVAVLHYAKVLYGSEQITFNIRDSAKEAKENFYHYYKIFQNIAETGIIKNKPGSRIYQLKWFVSMLLLMPSLYLQAKGIYLYKKFSFDFFKHPFLDKLSAARKNFRNAEKILGKNYLAEAHAMLQEWHKELGAYEKNRRFTNNPRRIPMAVYQKAIRELIEHFQKNSDVLSLYEYGSVSAPGISDLDLILVTKEKLKNKFLYPSGPNIDKVAKGTLMVMPESFFSNIRLFDEINLKKVFGQEIKLREIDQETIKLRAIASVVDWLPERLIRIIALLHKNPLDVQYALRYLRSFAYSLENTSKLIGDERYKEFLDNLHQLRKKWKQTKTDELLWLIKRGIYLGYGMLDAFTDKYLKNWGGAEGNLVLFKNQQIIFTDQKEKINADWSTAISDPSITKIVVSSKLLPHFWIYSRQAGKLAQEMKKGFIFSGKPSLPDSQYEKFLKKKIELAEKCAKYLRSNGFTSGLYRFGFYFKRT